MKELKRIFRLVLFFTVFTFILQQAAAAKDSLPAGTDSQPPEPPRELIVTNRTFTSISLSWPVASDDIKVKGYEVYRDGRKIITTSRTNFTNRDLIPGRKYTYAVKAYDAAGNLSSAGPAVEAGTVPDEQAPSTPGNLRISSLDYTSVVISWNPCTDNTAIKGYVVYKNGSRAAATSASSYTAKGLLPGVTYSFFVKSYDIAGNFSDQSAIIPGTTLKDTAVPGKPIGLKQTSVAETEITLVWSPSSDNVKVKGYVIMCNGEKAGAQTKTIYFGRNLTPGTSYKYTVKAVDTAGNISESSEPITITTLKDIEKPSSPAQLKASKVKGSSVTLIWNASSDNIKVNGYTIYCNGMELVSTKKTSRTVKNPFALGVGIYWVRAYDLAGNLSDTSNKITVITP